MVHTQGTSTVTPIDHAELSRPGSDWKNQRNGTRGGAEQGRHQRTNWYHPFLWIPIDKAARRAGWSAKTTVAILQRELPELFSQLNRGTVHKWFMKGGKGWSETTLANVKRRHALAGSGQVGILAKYPDIVEEFKTALLGLRTSGVAVSVLTGRSILLAIIKSRKPELLLKFKCSEVRLKIDILEDSEDSHGVFQYFIRSFFESALDWSIRRPTRAAAHIPDDAEEQCERTFFRLVYAMKWHDIPSKVCVHGMIHTQLYSLVEAGHQCGSTRQLCIARKHDNVPYERREAS